jgi:hypothetical protein
MEISVTSKKRAAKKAVSNETVLENEPFAAVAEPVPAKKRAVKKTVKAVKAAAPAVKAEAKPVKTKAKAVVLDPFTAIAEPVAATSPVKKPAAKKAKAEAKPVKAVAKAKTPKAVKKTVKKAVKKVTLDATPEIAAAEPKVELSPVFKALADVTLPELKRENRARLQMQTPTRLYFYWTVRENPWALLRKVFGDDLGSYTLVVKLIDKKHGREEIKQCEAEGNWWFNVEPDGKYAAEVGFYAPNRPYFRIIYSNTVETPRRSPSPRSAAEAKWTVSATKFAEVLDVAGFSQDAFDVALAGDDHAAAEHATHIAFSRFVGAGDYELHGISAEEIRYAMLALASGSTLEELRFRVSPALFAILQANVEKLAADKALAALGEHFDINEAEFTEEQFGPAVFGASLVNFPRTLKTKTVTQKHSPRYNPVSSHSLR